MTSKLNSFSRTKTASSNEIQIQGGDEKLDIAKARKTGSALESDTIELDTVQHLDPKTAAYEKFMAQEIEVILDEVGADEAGFVEVTVNGVRRLITADQPTKISRAHAVALAQAKQIRVVEGRSRPDADGFQGFEHTAKLKLAYPFRWKDPDPRGHAMLSDMVASRA